jgi:hypothetical protein
MQALHEEQQLINRDARKIDAVMCAFIGQHDSLAPAQLGLYRRLEPGKKRNPPAFFVVIPPAWITLSDFPLSHIPI